jgi:hypothetical protein
LTDALLHVARQFCNKHAHGLAETILAAKPALAASLSGGAMKRSDWTSRPADQPRDDGINGRYDRKTRMNLQVKFGAGDPKTITVPADATVKVLMELCTEISGLPNENQKIIFRGRTLADAEARLDACGLRNNAKVLLVGSDPLAKIEPEVVRAPLPSPFLDFSNRAPRVLMEEYMTAAPHSAIIQKGPPPRAMDGGNYQMETLPSEPFAVRDSFGDEATLAFRTEELSVDSGEHQNRIFYHEITSFGIQTIPGYEQKYLAIGFLMKGKKIWVYFVPKQYRSVIEAILQNRKA